MQLQLFTGIIDSDDCFLKYGLVYVLQCARVSMCAHYEIVEP